MRLTYKYDRLGISYSFNHNKRIVHYDYYIEHLPINFREINLGIIFWWTYEVGVRNEPQGIRIKRAKKNKICILDTLAIS